MIQDEAANFVRNNPQAINSKDLSTFERILAQKLGWDRAQNSSLSQIKMP
jgi:hypothetical protein